MNRLNQKIQFGKTGLMVPPIIYGTSYLGNLYCDLPEKNKLEIVKKWFEYTASPVVIDSAGKYGAGLALEMIGKLLERLSIDPEDIVISNKLGWFRIPLMGDQPTFEPGAWVNINNDAIQKISYQGILDCWEQGDELLGKIYKAQLVSVHDPDEYLAASKDIADRNQRFEDIIQAYKALFKLKEEGKILAVGVGSKDWKVIRELYEFVDFDWVMLACKFTIYNHSREIISFLDELGSNKVGVINSAVFNSGFITGGEYFDYRKVNIQSESDRELFKWRELFLSLCTLHNVNPGVACIKFAISHPSISSIALNTSQPQKMGRNVSTLNSEVSIEFWDALKENSILDSDYQYL